MTTPRVFCSVHTARSGLIAAAVAITAWSTAAHAAEETIAVTALPAAVTATVQEYFPGATIRTAQRSTEVGRADEYELALSYKAIQLEAEISPEGRILDVDLKKR